VRGLAAAAVAFAFSVHTAAAQPWPSFRGPAASGAASNQHLPDSWDGEAGTNVLWRTEIPGLGHSSPVVWGDRVFVTTAVGARGEEPRRGFIDASVLSSNLSPHSFRVYCLDRKTGRVLWSRVAHEGVPRAKRHVNASHANPTPATDGRHVVAFFASEGLFVYDLDGRLLWSKNLGVLDAGWELDPAGHYGFGSSPIIYRDLVIVQCDARGTSFIAAFRLSDGAEVWRTPRGESSVWSTPTLIEGHRPEVVTNGSSYLRGYDPSTGRELWRMAEGGGLKIPTPVSDGERIYFGGGADAGPRRFYAIGAGASGEILPGDNGEASGALAWRNRANAHILTPLVYEGLLYVSNDAGILTVYEARTGEQVYRQRLGVGASFGASPIAADGRIYFTNQDGDTHVLRAGRAFEIVGQGTLGELVMATPAISGRMLVFRTDRSVIAIGRKPGADVP
jgi:outer membrane protein assembly factor BamB